MKRKPSRRAAEDAAYETGYCKPPKHTQFKPGQSGHPVGRPRGQRNFTTAVREALKEKMTIREGGRMRKLSKMDVVIQVALNKALKGDAKGLAAIVQLARWAGLMDDESDRSATESFSAEDQAILDDYLARRGVKPRALEGEDPGAEADKDRKKPNTKGDEDEEPEDKT
jgi:hypothetical protein